MVVPFPDHRSALRKMDNDQIDDIYVKLQEKAIKKPKKNERYQIYHFFAKKLQASDYNNLSKTSIAELMLLIQHAANSGWLKFSKGFF